MKSIFTFIALLLITFIGVFHNPMMVFSMYQMDMGEKNGMNCSTENNKQCNMTCCLDVTTIQANLIISNHSFKEKITAIKLKIIEDFILIDYYKKNNYYISILTSPPDILSSYKNYGFYTLIKIIKSNI